MAKRFGETVALRSVDFAARGGEIHGLLGENGAGKTSLMNVLSGLYRPDEGQILLDGRPVEIRSPQDALRHRIGMVHQHVELIPSFTVLENVLLGREGSRWWLRVDRHRAEVAALARRFGLTVDLDAEVRRLAVGVQQKAEIIKSLYRGVDVLILDEPTTMLTPQEVDVLFATIRTLADGGVAVVFITHKIRELLGHCDRITVMRAGQVMGTLARQEVDEPRLVEMMIGERLTPLAADARTVRARATSDEAREASGALEGAPASVMLEVSDLTVAAGRGVPAVSDCTFALAAGTLVGLAGVAGNGQRELAEALLGLLPAASGTIAMGGRDVTRAAVRDRLAAGLVYIPEDRIQDGVLPGLSVAENVVLGLHRHAFAGVTFDRGTARDLARRAIVEYSIVARDEDARAIALSGGNIQKLIVARAMALAKLTRGVAVVAMNPTRGLDVRATDFVRRRLLAFAREGGAVLLVSEDLDELLQLCDRILVMEGGRLVGDLARAEFDAYRIGGLMAGAVPAT